MGFKALPKKFQGRTTTEIKEMILSKERMKQQDDIKITTSAVQKVKSKSTKKVTTKKKFRPQFGREKKVINTLSRFYGVLKGNIKSSGHRATFKITFLNDKNFPLGSYLACTGTPYAARYNYHIVANCSKLIANQNEYDVNVTIKNQDLTEGIEADYVYVNDEEIVLGEGFSALAAGIIESKKDQALTAIGHVSKPTVKNAIINGLVASAKKGHEKSRELSGQQTILLAIKDGKKVVIEFNERFEYESI
jgi:hypothetical protein